MPVRSLDDHFAEVDADTNHDALILGRASLPLSHAALDIDGALDRIDDASELRQNAVAHELEDAAAMLRYLRFNQFKPVGLQPLEGFRFILLDQPAVADDIGGEDGGQFAFH